MSEGMFLAAVAVAATVGQPPEPDAPPNDNLLSADDEYAASRQARRARAIRHLMALLEWGSTVVLLAGVALTAFNVFPLNLWVSLVANFGWMLLGVVWRKWSLAVVEVIITGVYVVGLARLHGLI